MAQHVDIAAALGMPVFFYQKASPWQRRILALEPTLAAVTGTVPTSSAAAAAVAFAHAAVGIPNQYGANGAAKANGEFDCSGLTQAAYAISASRSRTTPPPSGAAEPASRPTNSNLATSSSSPPT